MLMNKNIQINNLIIDPLLCYDDLNSNSALSVKGNVSIVNADINGGEKSYLIDRSEGELKLTNVNGYNVDRWLANNIGPTHSDWNKMYLSNCTISQNGTSNNIVPGIASNCNLAYVSENVNSSLRNRQTQTVSVLLGQNANISATDGRTSKIEIYDKKLVRIYLNLILHDTSKICTLGDSIDWARKNQEPFVGYVWNSSANPIIPIPCMCSIA